MIIIIVLSLKRIINFYFNTIDKILNSWNRVRGLIRASIITTNLVITIKFIIVIYVEKASFINIYYLKCKEVNSNFVKHPFKPNY